MYIIMSIDESKRLRRSLSFTDFPDTILKSVTDYLYPVSQALFAVALSAPSQSASWWTSNIQQHISISSKAIISNGQWNVLDFGTIRRALTAKLNDDDIRAVLVVIDARNKLKRLMLTNCLPVTYALQPLQGSIVLEQLDLDKNQQSLSVEAIVPFLVSIIDNHANSLKHITLPEVWAQRTSSSLDRFLRRYNGMLDYRRFNCAGCNGRENCVESESDVTWLTSGMKRMGEEVFFAQYFTCYKCLRNFCDDSDKTMCCYSCCLRQCSECAPPIDCAECCEPDNFRCSLCVEDDEDVTKVKCEECRENYCQWHKSVRLCFVCNMKRCRSCTGGQLGPEDHRVCKYCSKAICFDCDMDDIWYFVMGVRNACVFSVLK